MEMRIFASVRGGIGGILSAFAFVFGALAFHFHVSMVCMYVLYPSMTSIVSYHEHDQNHNENQYHNEYPRLGMHTSLSYMPHK